MRARDVLAVPAVSAVALGPARSLAEKSTVSRDFNGDGVVNSATWLLRTNDQAYKPGMESGTVLPVSDTHISRGDHADRRLREHMSVPLITE